MRLTLVPLAALLPALAAPLAAQCGMPMDQPAPHAELRIAPAELNRLRGDPHLVVLQTTMSSESYRTGHVPGARWVDIMRFMEPRGGLDHELPPAERLDSLLDAAGIRDGDRVVVYGDIEHLGRVFLALEAAGLRGRVALLDGGLTAWRDAGLPVTTEVPTARPGRYTPRPHTDVVVDAAWVRAHLDDPRTLLLDGRTPAEYAGTAHESLPRTGHIPGARLLNWTATLAGGSDGRMMMGDAQLADLAALQRLFRAAGADASRQIVVYCTIGMRAGQLYYIARYLGYDVKLYDGSMEDWSRRSELPITRGERP